MLESAKKCEFTGAGLPLGYKVVNKKFEIDEETAPIVRRIFERYLAGETMAEIIRYLNSCGVKTSRGNEYNKNSIRRILENKKYLGIYNYSGIEIPDGMPRIIEDDVFEQANELLIKNRKAPARLKAKEDNYLLSTKLFCGYCKCAMVGVSGTSKNGSLHQYYKCATARYHKGDCTKKNIQKQYIEDLVVDSVLESLNDKFKNGDASNYAFRISLIDTFVDRIYIYDNEDRKGGWVEIFCNASATSKVCPITEPKKNTPSKGEGGSVLGQMEPHLVPNTNTGVVVLSAFFYASRKGFVISMLATM